MGVHHSTVAGDMPENPTKMRHKVPLNFHDPRLGADGMQRFMICWSQRGAIACKSSDANLIVGGDPAFILFACMQ
jgi:hypothetical protein